MPIVEIQEFAKYKEEGYAGTFVGGCIDRGDGSSFRAKAHAHCCPDDPLEQNQGWICVRSVKRLRMATGRPSMLMLHELAHILAREAWHNDKWRSKVRELGGRIEEQYLKKTRG